MWILSPRKMNQGTRSTKWLASLPATPAGTILRTPPNRLQRSDGGTFADAIHRAEPCFHRPQRPFDHHRGTMCVLEPNSLALRTCEAVRSICQQLGLQFIAKASVRQNQPIKSRLEPRAWNRGRSD